MSRVEPDMSVFDKMRKQPEFNEQLWQYINRRVSDWRGGRVAVCWWSDAPGRRRRTVAARLALGGNKLPAGLTLRHVRIEGIGARAVVPVVPVGPIGRRVSVVGRIGRPAPRTAPVARPQSTATGPPGSTTVPAGANGAPMVDTAVAANADGSAAVAAAWVEAAAVPSAMKAAPNVTATVAATTVTAATAVTTARIRRSCDQQGTKERRCHPEMFPSEEHGDLLLRDLLRLIFKGSVGRKGRLSGRLRWSRGYFKRSDDHGVGGDGSARDAHSDAAACPAGLVSVCAGLVTPFSHRQVQ